MSDDRLADLKAYWATYREIIALERPTLADGVDWLIAEVERLGWVIRGRGPRPGLLADLADHDR